KTELPSERLDERRFRVSLTNVQQAVELHFAFNDTDGDSGKQVLAITPTNDETPQIKMFVPDVVRPLEDKFIITPNAVIPFRIVASDDHGLTAVEYLYTLQEAATASVEVRRAAAVAAAIGMTVRGPDAPLTSLLDNLTLPASLKRSEETLSGVQPVADFQAKFDRLRPQGGKDNQKGPNEPVEKAPAPEWEPDLPLKDIRRLDSIPTDPSPGGDRGKPFKGLNGRGNQGGGGNLLLSLKA